jgi:hypothetical protein
MCAFGAEADVLRLARYRTTVRDRAIPVVFCFDVEPDLHTFEPDDAPPWHGLEALVEMVPRLRARLERATGRPAQFSWALRIDPQIALGYGTPAYVFRRYGSFVEDALHAGDAVGVHPHAWRWDGPDQGWVSDHLDQAWVNECLEMAVSTYVDELGAAPSFHRYGGLWMSTATMNRVRDLGVRIDLTVEPGQPPIIGSAPHLGGLYRGGTADCRSAPRHPYHPDAQDFCRAAPGRTDDLWEIPLTSGQIRSSAPAAPGAPPRAERLPLGARAQWYARHPVGTGHRAVRRAAVRFGRPDQPRPFVTGERTMHAVSTDWPGASAFWDEALDSAVRADRSAPYLAFAIRSDSAINPHERQVLDSRMDWVVNGSLRRSLAFVRPDNLLADRRHSRAHEALSRLVRRPAASATRV